jgi:asparagine synthase (glutamine-hydrolysing)
MKCEIYLHNNYYFWENTKSNDVTIYHKGYAFIGNKLEDFSNITKNIIQKIEKNDSDSLKKYLNSLNGCFAIVIAHPNFIFASVDRIRSIPLFYSKTKKRCIVSDDANHIRVEIKPTMNEINAAEFLLTGFVTGQRTLFDDIFQLQVGEYLIYTKNSGTFEKDFYFRFHHQDFFDCSDEELIEKLDDVMISVFKRLIKTTVDRGKQIVVPLSGGLDSRLIVAMLKRLGVENVLCFTYGRKNDVEVQISKKVANTLGYEWHFVKYTRRMLYDMFHSKEMKMHQRYAGNFTSLPHIQDYFAVYYLKNKNIISKNSVIVPGHPGMIYGGYFPEILKYYINLDIKNISKYCLDRHYVIWKWSDKKLAEQFISNIRESIKLTCANDIEDVAGFIDEFNFNERQAKYIINSVRAYEFLNFQWSLPLCDLSLVNFFLKVPYQQRIKKNLYIKYINGQYFKDVNINNIPTNHEQDVFPVVSGFLQNFKSQNLFPYFSPNVLYNFITMYEFFPPFKYYLKYLCKTDFSMFNDKKPYPCSALSFGTLDYLKKIES